MRYDEHGHELPDDTPVAIPVGFRHPPSMQQMIKQYIRRELSDQAHELGAETIEEANDFDIEDDPPDPHSKWEHDLDPPEPPPSMPAVDAPATAPAAPAAASSAPSSP